MMRLAGIALLAMAAAAPAVAQQTPATAARDFYGVVVRLHQGGVPDPKTLAQLRPFISGRLAHQIEDANRAEMRYARNTHHAVPPLLEGDIFVSLFEGASAFDVGRCSEAGDGASCTVALSYSEDRQPPTRWTDTAYLVHEPGGWRLDDIGYGGGWDFGNKGKLSQNLDFAIHNADGD